MLELAGGSAVVVADAAKGIGLALATRLADDGMRVVLADVEEPALAAAATALADRGATALAVRRDVADAVVRAIRDRTFDVFVRGSVKASIAERARRMVEGEDPGVPEHLRSDGLPPVGTG